MADGFVYPLGFCCKQVGLYFQVASNLNVRLHPVRFYNESLLELFISLVSLMFVVVA